MQGRGDSRRFKLGVELLSFLCRSERQGHWLRAKEGMVLWGSWGSDLRRLDILVGTVQE